MRFKFLKTTFVSLVFSVSCMINLASAGIISGSHMTDGGKIVNLQNLEWLTWDLTYGVSRNQVESGYGNYLNDGWRYASLEEYAALLISLSPVNRVEYNHISNRDGTQWLWENFDYVDFSTGGSHSRTGDLMVGATERCGTTVACRVHWRAGHNNNYGWMSDYYGRVVNPTHYNSNINQTSVSSVLVRSTSVPEPSTLAIFALGIMGLASRRFKKQS
jgi:hypothetical protein